MFSCVSGFIEVGETVEDAVRREVMEETGVHLATGGILFPWMLNTGGSMSAASNGHPSKPLLTSSYCDTSHIGYHGSQPWPFPGSLMLGFLAKATSEDIELCDGELAEARWFSHCEIADVFREKSWRMRRSLTKRDGQNTLQQSTPTISIPPPLAIAHQLIRLWLEGHEVQKRAINSPATPHSRL